MKHLTAMAVEGFKPAEGCGTVSIVVASFSQWDVEKAAELIEAAPQIYEALCNASQHLAIVDPNWQGHDEMDRVIAKACGARVIGAKTP